MHGMFRKAFRQLSVCFLICAILALTGMPVYAAEDKPGLIEWISNLISGESDETPRGEFVNDTNDTPDLFVKKTVQSAVPEVDAPDAEFHFTVMIDGEYYGNQEYELYGADGKQIFNYSDGHGATGVKVPWMTDINGGFTLKDGQTARFPWVGPGREYEVFEELDDGSFVQTVPPGNGRAVGHIEPTGSSETFVNTWYPESKAKYARLEVTKSVVLPEGLDVPEMPEFEFVIRIAYKPYAGKAFTVMDSSGEVSTGSTDENGHFKIKGGQTAVFEEVVTGKDYSVEEVNVPGGWRQTGVTGEEESVKGPVTHAEFTNAFASFAVKKMMAGGSFPDVEFSFVLSGEEGPMGSVSYWRYDRDGHIIGSETTDEAGGFKLKPGETALFTMLDAGTSYKVHEVTAEGYVQTFPAGDFTGTVRDNALPVHEFINAVDGTAKLTVKKVNENGEPLEGVKFKLRKGSGGVFSPYAVLEEHDDGWIIKDWSNEGTELSTDANGQIVITGFEEGKYTLEETVSLEGYINIKPVTFDIGFDVSDQNELADITLTPNTKNRTDVSVEGSMKDGTGTLKITNREGPQVPETGGPGRVSALLAGTFVFGAGLLVLRSRRKRK